MTNGPTLAIPDDQWAVDLYPVTDRSGRPGRVPMFSGVVPPAPSDPFTGPQIMVLHPLTCEADR